MTTLARIARDHSYAHLTVTDSPVKGDNDLDVDTRTYYRWDVELPIVKGFSAAYVALIDHISEHYGKPVLYSTVLSKDAPFTPDNDSFCESIYVEAKDEMPCPAFVEDGSCIHSDHTP